MPNLDLRLNLSTHLSLAEACASLTASAKGLVNVPTVEQVNTNGVRLAALFEQMRALPLLHGMPWISATNVHLTSIYTAEGKPFITMHSIFRNTIVNKLVGGSPNSAHTDLRAMDFDPPKGMTHDELQHAIYAALKDDIDIIAEEGTQLPENKGGSRWLHVQIAPVGMKPRQQLVDWTVDRLGGTIVRRSAG